MRERACLACHSTGTYLVERSAQLPDIAPIRDTVLMILLTMDQHIDPVTELIPVRPVVHYMMGGVHTDIHGATTLPGLYAAGETACVSINGANRLGSNSLPELLVFGARAGHAGN